jgi:hypothetical protein
MIAVEEESLIDPAGKRPVFAFGYAEARNGRKQNY